MPLLEALGSAAAKGFGFTSFISSAFDEFFNRTSLLLSGDGSNGTSNSSFIDYGPNNISLTKNGNVAPGSFNPFLDNYSVYYDGSSWSQISDNEAFNFGSGNFTVEFWAKTNDGRGSTSNPVFNQSTSGASSDSSIFVGFGTDASVYVSDGTGWDFNATSTGITCNDNAWHHVAAVRNGTSLQIYVDGISRGSTTLSGGFTLGNSTRAIQIGSQTPNSSNYIGFVSNLRVVKGTAVYTENFVPSITKLTAIANTSLLTNQSNRWSKDLSSNNFTISLGAGTPQISALSPFKLNNQYSTTDGSSYYFDSSGDRIQVGDNTQTSPSYSSWLQQNGSRTGTLETWVYLESHATSTQPYMHRSFWNKGNTFMNLGVRENGKVRWYWYDGSVQNWIDSSGSINLKEWTHIAFDLNGSAVAIYINGVSQNLARFTNNNSGAQVASDGVYSGITNVSNYAAGDQFHIGGGPDSVEAQNYWHGYISNLRILPTTRLYTSNFTPPTTPLSSITNTQLLIKGENTAINDFTRMNNLESVGNVQLSTSVKKYGAASIFFDGSGDALITKSSFAPLRNIGTTNFTVEGWFYPTSFTVDTIFRRLWASGTSLSNDISLNIDTNGNLYYRNNDNVLITSSSNLSLNNWSHVALVRNNGTTTIYLNGVSVGTTTTNNDLSTPGGNPMYIGNHPNLTGSWSGYIDDFRVSRFARYTSTFSVPAEEFSRT